MQTRFTENNFTAILLREFQKHGIYNFSQRAVQKELYIYSLNPKYKPLFFEVDCRYNQANLGESLGFLQMFRCIYSINPDFDRKYISPDAEYYISKEELKDYEDLMVEMINEYALKRRVALQSKINLKIRSFNPNVKYNLVRGKGFRSLIEWGVVTDGEPNIIGEEKNIEHIFWPYPHLYHDNDHARLQDVKATLIEVNNATFAIRQGMIDNQVVAAEILTETLDESKLLEMANYALLDKSTEEPLVRVLRQK